MILILKRGEVRGWTEGVCKAMEAIGLLQHASAPVRSHPPLEQFSQAVHKPRVITHRTESPEIHRQRLVIAADAPLKESLLILDDCFEQPKQLDNQMMHALFKQGRHLKAAVLVVTRGPREGSIPLPPIISPQPPPSGILPAQQYIVDLPSVRFRPSLVGLAVFPQKKRKVTVADPGHGPRRRQ
jgi:hypothetical protein